MNYFDIHTHTPPLNPNEALYSCSFKDASLPNTGIISVGIHPWDLTENNAEELLHWLEKSAKNPGVVAIGECGIDKLRGISINKQIDIFQKCIMLSEQMSLPVIIHAVKCTEELIRIKKEIKPKMPWIIHGFRGKVPMAQSLLKHGFYLSFGEHYQEESLKCTPLDKIFLETDESSLPIEDIYKKAAFKYGITTEILKKSVISNAQKVLFLR